MVVHLLLCRKRCWEDDGWPVEEEMMAPDRDDEKDPVDVDSCLGLLSRSVRPLGYADFFLFFFAPKEGKNLNFTRVN